MSGSHVLVFAKQHLADLRHFETDMVDVLGHRKIAFDDHHETAPRERLLFGAARQETTYEEVRQPNRALSEERSIHPTPPRFRLRLIGQGDGGPRKPWAAGSCPG